MCKTMYEPHSHASTKDTVCATNDRRLIRRWDSERALFYDDMLHVLQCTIDLRINSGTDIGHTVFTVNRKQQETVKTVKRNLNDKLQVSNGEIHSTAKCVNLVTQYAH